MPNRFNAKGKITYGQEPLPTGYPVDGSVSNLTVPSVGLRDIDNTLFELFENDLKLQVGGKDGADLKKVPIIFAGGEKWALLKRNRPMRDKTGSLVLPLITMGRTNFTQTPDDTTGRGINQRTGEIVIRRRLDKSDRGYQNLINRIFLKHQHGLAVPPGSADVTQQLTTLRSIGDLANDGVINDGGLLVSDRLNNVYETIVVPSPQFITANYDVIVWTQYVSHMNQILEQLVSSFLQQTQGWRLDTPSGYWFVATINDDIYNAETNFDDMSQGERIIKYKFSIKVPAYIFASSAPGVPVPVKRYVSSPNISFDAGIIPGEEVDHGGVTEPFLGSDDPTLPINDVKNNRRDQRRDGRGRLFSTADVDPNDPALQSRLRGEQLGKYARIVTKNTKGQLTTKYVRKVTVNPVTGETSYAPGTDLGSLSIVVIEE